MCLIVSVVFFCFLWEEKRGKLNRGGGRGWRGDTKMVWGGGGGFNKFQLRTKHRENGDLGAVAP